MKIESIRNATNGQGQRELIKHMEGKTLTRSQAMKAKCYECMGGYKDGKVDCRVSDCPIYPWMPFLAAGPRKLARASRSTDFGRNKVALNT